MSVQVDTTLFSQLQRYGAGDISACYNCGVCSAICPLSTEAGAFPRRIIRFVQLGRRDKLLASHELWSCYGCGECTKACPNQADPAEFMAATRRYAVAQYDPTGLAGGLATSWPLAVVVIGLLVALMAAFMYSAARSPVGSGSLALFDFVPSTLIHNLGIGVLVLWALAAGAGLLRMVRHVARGGGPAAVSPMAIVRALWRAIAIESLGQSRYRRECSEDQDPTEGRQLILRRWFVHASIMWGFLGLLGATILDYLLELVGVKSTGTAVPLWYPVRLLGTIAGVALMYGTTVILVRRVRKSKRSYERSTVSDWTFLGMLWLTGLTGFAIELALYLPGAPSWAYPVFLLHVALAMVLVLLVPFGKFGHVVYRPVALAILRLHETGNEAPKTQTETQAA